MSTISYPVNLDLTDRPVLVVGGGPVAARKVSGLLRAGARVTVVAPDAVPEISEDPDVQWFPREYRRGEVASYRLAITATDQPAVNTQVRVDGDAAGVFVNSADDPANCSFTLPAVARHGDLQVAISTGGRSPALSRWLRRRLETELGAGYDHLLDLLEEVRAELRTERGTSEHPGWDAALDQDLLELARTGRIEEARRRLRSHVELRPTPAEREVAS
ncbi:MAG: bifunctional precorrin-2 dehydrogenase/sirohydrochlorin ferrochelatase [Actinobacteria bacterium]|nr:bifunctional precorrin-2 dehydrogenase/sirohydrochlorin ferrochelatase [Actinomycetota bacterium]NIS33656.1 bifunctional precorrin-2 dehydrogenase/sirohydrochlorin ferrochelatase [Actinomycetota bacterium]NIT97010.1 bifunctional precorrin-2 dehydrogenase/sirohydrochlorin ferrochelatase [Actinomycetota bacterium]NIU20675.1 bifunctional precorrin-2 dehydrogenase/sirohydrochlorin ferrochelatase [Actinomycetota bacterium]NIU68512.1 bifunctional precorrin-2 dehydrogenase/sirohydrochlorin ferroche